MAVPAGPLATLISADDGSSVWVLFALGGGIVAGLFLLARGFADYRAASRIGGISTSRISSIAVGEVLVSGAAEPIELTLVSPLQSAPCLYYRARVTDTGRDSDSEVFREERAVGFRVRDATGAVRVFPAGARFDVPDRYDEHSGRWDDDPPGLEPRVGSAFGPGPDRESQIAALLTVRDPSTDPWSRPAPSGGNVLFGGAERLAIAGSNRHYTEARIEAGDVVTVVGRVLPFSEVSDPTMANLLDVSMVSATDPEVAADLAAARASGQLAATPAAAWGNAAIEGFGIGRPVRSPLLDAEATPPPPPDPSLEARAREAFEIAPEALVLAAGDDAPLFVSLGAPAAITARHRSPMLVGLFGAIVAIASAMTLAVLLSGAS
jgi:hypothetical protein